MAWSFVLTDSSYTPIAEVLNAYDRTVTLPVSQIPTATMRLRVDHPLIPALDTCDGYLKCYRNGVLRFFGPIITQQEVGDKQGVVSNLITAAGAGWYLAHRMAGKSATGIKIVAPTDQAQIIKQLIDTTNTENETGIDTTGSITAAGTSTYTAAPYKYISECVLDLCSSLNGFDWRFDPLENWVSGALTSQKIASYVAAPVLSTVQNEAIFEYGLGRSNVADYQKTLDRTTQANQVYHNVPAGPDAPGYPTIHSVDPASIARYKMLEDLAQADLSDLALRQQLTDEHVKVRKQPRTVWTFNPHREDGTTRVPRFGVDYDVGDQVRGRVVYRGVQRLDAMVRLWVASFAIDAQGAETPTLTLSDQGASF